jgi:hypothetical protein
MKKTKRTWRWVTRDDDRDSGEENGVWVWAGGRKPIKRDDIWVDGSDGYNGVEICQQQWDLLFGIEVNPEKPVKVEFKAKIIN